MVEGNPEGGELLGQAIIYLNECGPGEWVWVEEVKVAELVPVIKTKGQEMELVRDLSETVDTEPDKRGDCEWSEHCVWAQGRCAKVGNTATCIVCE